MAGAELIRVQVAYAAAHAQIIRQLSVEPDASIEQVIQRSGILGECPEIDLAVNRVGIFAVLARLSDRVRDGDRIEIYRALIADPKEARRRRASKQVK